MLIPCDEVNILNTFRVMIILRLLLLLTNLHLELLSTQGTVLINYLALKELKSFSLAGYNDPYENNVYLSKLKVNFSPLRFTF